MVYIYRERRFSTCPYADTNLVHAIYRIISIHRTWISMQICIFKHGVICVHTSPYKFFFSCKKDFAVKAFQKVTTGNIRLSSSCQVTQAHFHRDLQHLMALCSEIPVACNWEFRPCRACNMALVRRRDRKVVWHHRLAMDACLTVLSLNLFSGVRLPCLENCAGVLVHFLVWAVNGKILMCFLFDAWSLSRKMSEMKSLAVSCNPSPCLGLCRVTKRQLQIQVNQKVDRKIACLETVSCLPTC